MQYEIKEEELDEMIRESEDKTLLQMKLQDVKVLYQAFREYLSGHFMTAEEVLEVLAKEIQFSEKLKGSVLLLDGYTGFTPVQLEVLRELLAVCAESFRDGDDGCQRTVSCDGKTARAFLYEP